MTTKHDNAKLRPTLLPMVSLDLVLEVLEFGAKKYATNNWKTVPDGEQRYLDAMLRHTMAVAKGEVIDEESGLTHMAHAVCCGLFHLHLANEPENSLEKFKRPNSKKLRPGLWVLDDPIQTTKSVFSSEDIETISRLTTEHDDLYAPRANVLWMSKHKYESVFGEIKETGLFGAVKKQPNIYVCGLKILIKGQTDFLVTFMPSHENIGEGYD